MNGNAVNQKRIFLDPIHQSLQSMDPALRRAELREMRAARPNARKTLKATKELLTKGIKTLRIKRVGGSAPVLFHRPQDPYHRLVL